MPEPESLMWIYGGVLAAFVVAALAYDIVRRMRRRQAAPPQVSKPLPRERMARIVGNGRVGPVQSAPVEPASPPATASAVATGVAATRLEAPAAGAPAPSAAATPEAAPPVSSESWWTRLVSRPTGTTGAGHPTGRSSGPIAADRRWSLSEVLAFPRRILGEFSSAAPSVADQRLGPAKKRPIRLAGDAEFLPAALEILEKPPSPAATAMMLGICTMCVAALLWSIIGHLDIHAVAQGKLQPSGRTKVVQPLEPGRVAAIHVESGKLVKEGDVLVELDPTDTAADLEALTRELESVAAEAARRNTAVAAARALDRPVPQIAYPDLVGPRVRERETDILRAELAQLRSAIEGFRAQMAEREATKQRLTASINARGRALALSRERVGMREEIRTRGAGSRALIIDSELQYENIAITDASERGQLAEADAGIRSLEARLVQAGDQFVAEQIQKASEAERRRDRLEQEIIKARSKRDRQKLRAPTAGSVQQIEVSTLGQVVASGQSLMSVVPIDAPLEVEAMILNRDVGFARPGQRAVVKIEAFPFTRYGTIEAEVVKVSTDAVDDRNATAMMDAATAARPQANANPRTSPGQNLVFPAVLRLDRRTMIIDGKEIALTPGMAATVEIKTGSRRAISYVLSPLSEVVSTSAKER